MRQKLITPTPPPTRQGVPPRPKNQRFNSSRELHVTQQEEETTVINTKTLLQESTSNRFTDVEGEITEVSSDVNLESVPVTKQFFPTKDEPSVLAKDTNLFTEGPELISWKSMNPPQPPTLIEGEEHVSPAKSALSITVSQESIVESVSLNERMSVFQVNVGPGPANPPPLPKEKPMWEHPPKPISSPLPLGENPPFKSETVTRSLLLDTESMRVPAKKSTEQGGERGEVKKDTEEQVIVGRQRLEMSKIGKVPPVIAPKPTITRPDILKEEEARPGLYCVQ